MLGIDPFDQPDVEASKIATRELTDAYEETGALPAETPFFEGEGVALFADAERTRPRWRRRCGRVAGRRPGGAPAPRSAPATTSRCSPTCEMNAEHERVLQAIRDARPRRAARRHLRRLRPALPALDRPGLQGRPEHAASSCRSPCDDAEDLPVPGRALHVRRRQGRAGARRLAGARRARPPRAARAPRARRGRRAGRARGRRRRRLCRPRTRTRRSRRMQLGMVGLGRMGANMVRRV